MGPLAQAIIQLRQMPRHRSRCLVGCMPGVIEAWWEPADLLIAVCFDRRVTSIADLVRQIEEQGSIVASIAERSIRHPAARRAADDRQL